MNLSEALLFESKSISTSHKKIYVTSFIRVFTYFSNLETTY